MRETAIEQATRIANAAAAAAAEFERGMLAGGATRVFASLWRAEYEAAWRAGAETEAARA